jgi:hypothetical protein
MNKRLKILQILLAILLTIGSSINISGTYNNNSLQGTYSYIAGGCAGDTGTFSLTR